MYTVALVVLGLAAITMADPHVCGPLQKLKVKHQWAEAYGSHGIHREKLAREVWHYIFKHAPKSASHFERVRGDNTYSPEFNAHMVRVMGGLDMSISLLNDEATLNAELAHLQSQHKARGIPNEYFDVMRNAINDVIPHYVARNVHFDKDAWDSCFELIANGIKS